MYLKLFRIKNFRTIRSIEVNFNKGLNILVGENNIGKSAIIDALRLSLTYGDPNREIYIKKTDFHVDTRNPHSKIEEIEFHLTFEIENEEESGIFTDMLVQNDDGSQNLQLHYKYFIKDYKGIERIKYKIWGGEKEGQPLNSDVLDLFYTVHLGALRDAVHGLKPIRGNRLGQLFLNLIEDKNGNPINKDKREELSNKLLSALKEDTDWINLIELGKEKVNEHLKETSINGKMQSVEIDFFPLEYQRIVDNLRIQIPVFSKQLLQGEESKQSYFDISQNGLGYNNLIFIATVLGDLNNRRQIEPESYTALLIEEPEAHLHPQLQNILFNYLNKLKSKGIQIFVSSHSPTITAKADLNSLLVLHEYNNKQYSFAINNSKLSDANKKYLSKFLDVTKSQLFFSNGVILVEGIAEALLVSEFSKMIGNNEEYSIEKNGIELVNINGIAFEHFAKLFNSDDDNKRLNIRSTIISDDDRDIETDEIASRAKNALKLEKGLLKVKLAKKTFEYELFIAGEANSDILMELFTDMHPKAAKRISKGNSIEEYASNFLNKVVKNKAKSELAHRLVILLSTDIEKRKKFKIPNYIQEAIKWVVRGE